MVSCYCSSRDVGKQCFAGGVAIDHKCKRHIFVAIDTVQSLRQPRRHCFLITIVSRSAHTVVYEVMDQHDSVSYRKMGLVPTGDGVFATPEQREGVDSQDPINVGFSWRLGGFRNALAIQTQGR